MLNPNPTSSIYLTWTDSQNTAVFYNLTRDGTLIQQFANTFFAYTDTGLSAETTYAYEITGVDGSNNAVYLLSLMHPQRQRLPQWQYP